MFPKFLVSGGVKATGTLLTPFGKINLYITLFFLSFLLVFSSVQCIRQNSLNPLLDNIAFKIVGADHQVGKLIIQYSQSDKPVWGSVFSKNFWETLWVQIKFWFALFINVYFVFVLIYGLYLIFKTWNSSLVLRNIVFALVFFGLIQVITGLFIFFPQIVAGKQLPDDQGVIRNIMISQSYPFEGLTKAVIYFADRDGYNRIYEWLNSGWGVAVSNIPNEYLLNYSLNESEVFL